MCDFRKMVSYIYSYSGGVRDKNVGFAKTEVRDGEFKINVSLKGVYTDAPEVFGVYLLVDKGEKGQGSATFLHVGNIMVTSGVGKYEDLLNAQNLNSTGYSFDDVSGVAVAKEEERFYMLVGMWDDDFIDMSKVRFVPKDYRRAQAQEVIIKEVVNEQVTENINDTKPEEIIPDEEPLYTVTVESDDDLPPIPQMEALFKDCDFVDAFNDDYMFDCVEVTLEQLRNTPLGDEEIVNNTFLEHGYYNFQHVLLGRVQKNEKHTEYFIGVPGMYCNRERFMASMFGFNNFKKSHRSDYSNPYFGYWYQEI